MENFRIESLEINEIGPFKHLKLDFPLKKDVDRAEIHILTGENGTGKSTILEALAEPTNISFQVYNLLKKFWKVDEISKSSFKIKYSESIYPITWVLGGQPYAQTGDYLPAALDEYVRAAPLPNLFISDMYFGLAFFGYSGYRRVSNIKIKGINEIEESPIKNATDFNASINPQNLIQWLVNIQTRELIAKGKGDYRRAKQYRSTIETLENTLSEITESEINFDLEEELLRVKITIDGQTLNFDQLPDGLKSMVSWMGDLLMRMDRLKWVNDTPVLERNFILLLDEIEVHLHPAWQRKILPVVQKLFKNAQIFISTHSPFVVGSVDGAWVHRFEKKDGYSVLAGPPILSEDAKSYDYILEEIFGVKERFGVEVERKLQDFQALKTSFLAEQRQDDALRLHQLVKELLGQSTELDSIVGMELRQLKRLTNQDFSFTEV
ncbi:AAA family ATPase [Runella limosa]|uniref:AAA family ATPase n=1 Tax=Runella limosa TaxID=370978 RepID=UPI0003FFC906|nr:AAA family ATPase [Runella limosa]